MRTKNKTSADCPAQGGPDSYGERVAGWIVTCNANRVTLRTLLVHVLEHQKGVAHLLALAFLLFRKTLDETRVPVKAQHGFLIYGIDGQQAHGEWRCRDDTADQIDERVANAFALQFGCHGKLGDLDGRVVTDRYVEGQAQVGTFAAAQMHRVGRKAEIGDRDVETFGKHRDRTGQTMRIVIARIIVEEFIELGASATELLQNRVFNIMDVPKGGTVSINGHSP